MTNQVSIRKRDPSIDIAKAIGIALVVLGHVTGDGEGALLVYLRDFVYQFHVPLFFFLSGYCFKADESWKPFLVKKIKNLYLPFVAANFLFMLVSLLARRLSGEEIILSDVFRHCIRIVCGRGVTPLGGATWFLITLFQAVILYKLVRDLVFRFFRKNPLLYLSLLSFAFGLIGIKWEFLWSFDKAFFAVMFLCAGQVTKEKGILDRIDDKQKLLVLFAGVVLVFICSLYNHSNVAFHIFGIIPVYLISAFAGIGTTMVLSRLLASVPSLSFIGDWGKRTLWILLGHFAAFKIITIAQIAFLHQPWSAIFTHPCNYVGGIWAVLYFLTGFFVPLYLSVFLDPPQKR